MTSAERTIALSHLGRNIAAITLGWQRAWTFVEPTEDVYAVYLQNGDGARIYLQYESSKGYNLNDRVLVTGWQHIGKNGSYVEVYDRGADGTGWNRVSAPRITVATSKNPEAVAKDIAKRFLPEYLRVFALAQAKVQADADYEAKITANLLRLAVAAKVKVDTSPDYRGEVRKSFNFGKRYHTATASADSCSLKLDNLTLAEAEHIVKYLSKKGTEPNT